MGFWRWLRTPHFPPLSLTGYSFGLFMTGWFHHWLLAVSFTVFCFAVEYLFASRDSGSHASRRDV